MKLAQTVFLKHSFFEQHVDHKEILTNKAGRPYLSLIIECNGKIFAIPFRTNIKHPYAFTFKKSGRISGEKKGLPGIVFTKAVVIQQSDIESQCTIDKREWIELNKNLTTIVTNFTDYLKKFAASLENSDFSKLPIFKYSSLQYFIEDVKSVVNSL
jgi:protein AbiQ